MDPLEPGDRVVWRDMNNPFTLLMSRRYGTGPFEVVAVDASTQRITISVAFSDILAEEVEFLAKFFRKI